MNQKKSIIFVLGLLLTIVGSFSIAINVNAADDDSVYGDPIGEKYFSDTNIQYSYTNSTEADWLLGYGSDNGQREQVRFEHQSTWKFGENYFFGDVVRGGSTLGDDCVEFGADGSSQQSADFLCSDGHDQEFYGVYNGNLSASRISKALGSSGIQWGPVKDVTLEWRFEYGSFFNYSASAYGLSLYFDVPWYVEELGDKVQLTWWRRDNCDDFIETVSGGCYEDHNYWGLTTRKEWQMLGLNWTHQLFWRYQQSTGGDLIQKRNPRHFAEFELIADIWNGLGVGFRLEYFSDKGGINASGDDSDLRPLAVARFRF